MRNPRRRTNSRQRVLRLRPMLAVHVKQPRRKSLGLHGRLPSVHIRQSDPASRVSAKLVSTKASVSPSSNVVSRYTVVPQTLTASCHEAREGPADGDREHSTLSTHNKFPQPAGLVRQDRSADPRSFNTGEMTLSSVQARERIGIVRGTGGDLSVWAVCRPSLAEC